MIDHTRDDLLTFAAMEQFRGKYLVKNRVSGEIYETPQMCYILVSATLFANYPKETRMKYVKKYYDAISKFDISLPRSEEHTSELQSLMRISYAVFCLKKKNTNNE